MQGALKRAIKKMTDNELIDRIKGRKRELGDKLVILGHHYQRKEIVELSDFRGDSFGLSRNAASQRKAKFIVFCGVKFMAESAAILAGPDQIVQLPEMSAGCPMADMAELEDVQKAWYDITQICGENVIPITYMNSSAAVKAFCGKHRGAVCTSSNAQKLFQWVYSQAERLFFLPDEYLGTNTANKIGIPRENRVIWDYTAPELGGNTEEQLSNAKLIIWKGYCHVHTWFTVEHVKEARSKYPDGIIVVHPECIEEVVNLSDYDGSTAFIVKYVQNTKHGSTIIIGTEINLVSRLAYEHPEVKVVELARSLCPNMFKINLRNLLWTLDNIGKVNIVTVPEEVKINARIALNRMLEVAL